ncbi:MAG: AlkA N-terminal domain-containing protein [Planctomycetota bacterium]
MKIQGVVTTGIYCRADCRARPHRDNVRSMPNSLAALAKGFRPCLLCRPDRLPDLGATARTPAVAKALRLVVSGFLDDASTADLATCVGYSTRQLDRLFEAEIGASPDFVARASRAHMARRLLDESDLSITDIAFAAGFASIRQMNRVMRDLFAFSPSELRRKRRRGDVLAPLDGGLRLRVPHGGAIDPTRMLEYLASRAIPGIEEVVDSTYRRTIKTCGHPGVAEVRDAGDGQHLEVTLHLATFGSILDQVQRARAMFGLSRGDTGAERALRRDAAIGAIVRAHPGLRMPGAWDRFETSVRVLIGQQVSVAGASTVAGRLVERIGTRIDLPLSGTLHSLFPSPQDLAAASPDVLDMPRARAQAILAFAQAVATGELDLVAAESLDELVARLTERPGIGPWSAHLIAARVFDQPDAFPASDLGLRKGAASDGEIPSARELERMSAAWRPYRTTACAYLWLAAAAAAAAASPKPSPNRRT